MPRRDGARAAGQQSCLFLAGLFFALLAVVISASAAEWTVRAAPSDAIDLPAATVANEQGHRLYLWEQHEGGTYRIFAELHLGTGAAFGGAMPTYRIDERPVVDTEEIRQKGEAQNMLTGHVGETAAFWLIWSSTEPVVRRDQALHDWTTGRELVVSFRRADGTAETTRFPLAGAAEAISNAGRVAVE